MPPAEMREWFGFLLAAALVLIGIGRWIGTREQRERAQDRDTRDHETPGRSITDMRDVLRHLTERGVRLEAELTRLQSPKWLDTLQVQIGGARDEIRRELDTMTRRIDRIEQRVFNGQ